MTTKEYNLEELTAIKIDFRGSMTGCWPRMLWQELFNLYRKHGGDLTNMDNMLIDYELCKELFDAIWHREVLVENPTREVLWSFASIGSTEWTLKKNWCGDIQVMKEVLSYENIYHIQVHKNEVIITPV